MDEPTSDNHPDTSDSNAYSSTAREKNDDIYDKKINHEISDNKGNISIIPIKKRGRPAKQKDEKIKRPVGRPRKTEELAYTPPQTPRDPPSQRQTPQIQLSPMQAMAKLLADAQQQKREQKITMYRSFLPYH